MSFEITEGEVRDELAAAVGLKSDPFISVDC